MKIERMNQTKQGDLEAFQMGFEIEKIGNEAIREIKRENRKLGLPVVFSRNGEIFYEMPDGTITKDSPFREN